jgi:hypothetical protein
MIDSTTVCRFSGGADGRACRGRRPQPLLVVRARPRTRQAKARRASGGAPSWNQSSRFDNSVLTATPVHVRHVDCGESHDTLPRREVRRTTSRFPDHRRERFPRQLRSIRSVQPSVLRLRFLTSRHCTRTQPPGFRRGPSLFGPIQQLHFGSRKRSTQKGGPGRSFPTKRFARRRTTSEQRPTQHAHQDADQQRPQRDPHSSLLPFQLKPRRYADAETASRQEVAAAYTITRWKCK